MKKLFVLIIAVVLSSSVFAKMDSTIRPLFKAVKKGQNSEVTHLLKQDVYKSKINATVGKKKIPLLFIAAKKGSRAVLPSIAMLSAEKEGKSKISERRTWGGGEHMPMAKTLSAS